MKTRSITITGVFLLATFSACSNTPQITDGSTQLSDQETQAVNAGLDAVESIELASQAAESPVSDAGTGSAQTVPDEITVGTCPELTAGLGDELTSLSITVDFGDGCQPVASDQTCSGSASGSLDRTRKSVTLTFDDLSCSDKSLNGSASLGYEVDTDEVSLDGNWDLTYADGNATTSTDGEGTVVVDGKDRVTRISRFDGTVSNGTTSWSLSASDVQLSVSQTGTVIPFSGTISLSGSDIRDVTIRFNEESPTTGEVEISIAGGPFVTVDLNDLG